MKTLLLIIGGFFGIIVAGVILLSILFFIFDFILSIIHSENFLDF